MIVPVALDWMTRLRRPERRSEKRTGAVPSKRPTERALHHAFFQSAVRKGTLLKIARA